MFDDCLFELHFAAGVSEDSDYTSDVNYPVGQHANSSASQFYSAAHQLNTPQRSLNSSRENSYETEDDYHHRNNGGQYHHKHSAYLTPPAGSHAATSHHSPNSSAPSTSYSRPKKQLPNISAEEYTQKKQQIVHRHYQQRHKESIRETETEPLYYNSRPHENYKPNR